jgi:acetoin utilization deacetylase AcuC-like enzyme
MARVGLVSDPVFETHDTGPGHPERAERLAVVRRTLADGGLVDRCVAVEPRLAETAWLERVHDEEYVRRVEQACARGEHHLDSWDVAICPESARVARLAAGSLVALCDDVVDGALDRGLALVRPPGHHAERDLAMGFCLFNNVAVAARHVVEARGIERVLIVDWDVHHGNGTQHAFEEDPAVLFYSSHQYPLYPGTGTREERGRGAGEGTIVNCPLPPGAGDDAFLAALRDELVPAADRFRPELVLVSAGFDAHAADPLAQLEVTTEAFAEATSIVLEIAERHAGGKLVATLEGGYDLDALASCVRVHLWALLDDASGR